MLMDVIKLGESVWDIDYFFIGKIRMCAVIVVPMLIFEVFCGSLGSFEFEVCWAVSALGSDDIDVSILFVDNESERVDSDACLSACVVFQHRLQNADIAYLAVFGSLQWEVETTHFNLNILSYWVSQFIETFL